MRVKDVKGKPPESAAQMSELQNNGAEKITSWAPLMRREGSCASHGGVLVKPSPPGPLDSGPIAQHQGQPGLHVISLPRWLTSKFLCLLVQ